MSLAQETNRYLEEKSPWKAIKKDRQACATALFVSLSVLSYLKTMLYPFLPFSSQKLHHLLGFGGSIEEERWGSHTLNSQQRLAPPEPLFAKLDDQIVAEETSRLGYTPG